MRAELISSIDAILKRLDSKYIVPKGMSNRRESFIFLLSVAFHHVYFRIHIQCLFLWDSVGTVGIKFLWDPSLARGQGF